MAKIINYFKRRREIKLRKWCIDHTSAGRFEDHALCANCLYGWITSGRLE